MRCKACNNPVEVRWFQPPDSLAILLESLCPLCLHIVRATLYDGGPDNEIDVIMELGYVPPSKDSQD